MFKDLKEHQRSLQMAYKSKPCPNFMDIERIEERIDQLMLKEELYWKQRSREEWLKWGDRNTRWFHKKASMRKQRNSIFGIKDSNGSWKEHPEDVQSVFVNYFTELFSSSNPSYVNIENVVCHIAPSVTPDMNDMLLALYLEEDVKKALFQMFPTKAPGPDGFLALFFQKFLEIINQKLMATCLHILNDGGSVRGLNSTNIALIPKVKRPVSAADFRPISLCNISYKIVAKILANRLKVVLNSIISESQSAFVPGRLITCRNTS